MWKKILSYLLLSLLLFVGTAAATDEPHIKLAPTSEAFLKYQAAKRSAARGDGTSTFKRGYIPSPIDLSHLSTSEQEPVARSIGTSLPAKYDPRSTGLLSAAKSQAYENCWAYAAIGALETSYKKRTGQTLDLSEKHLTWYAYNSSPGLTYDEENGPLDNGGFDNGAVATLARWIGAVLETDLPEKATPKGPYTNYENRLHLEDAFILGLQFEDPGKFDRKHLKEIVYEYGAASVSVNYNDDDENPQYFNALTSAYYTDSKDVPNHAVLLVGWDDNFPRENFNERLQPSKDGAWLIRNSWGTDWGDDGYYWVSYEDGGFSEGVVYLAGESTNYDDRYEHDELGWCYSAGLGSETAWMANIFSATDATQMMEAVSFYTTANNAEYEVYVYTDLKDPDDPTSGTLALTQRGSEPYAGYHTIELSNRVEVAARSHFSVAVKMRTPGYNYPLAVELTIEDYSENAVVNAGESFSSTNGQTWIELAAVDEEGSEAANACIKAFTTYGNGGPEDDPLPYVSEKPADWTKEQSTSSTGAISFVLRTPWFGTTEVTDVSITATGMTVTKCAIEDSEAKGGTPQLVVEGSAASAAAMEEATIYSVSYKMSGWNFTYRISSPVVVSQISTSTGTPGPGETEGDDGGSSGCNAAPLLPLIAGAALMLFAAHARKKR